jgi:ABC-type sugar transport system permease subunit
MFYLLVVNVIGSFQSYAQVNLLTRGGPANSTRVIVYQIYEEAFRYGKYGSASAQSVILFAILFTLTLIEFIGERKVTY